MRQLLDLAWSARSRSPYPRPWSDRAARRRHAGGVLVGVAVLTAAAVVVVTALAACLRRVTVEGTSMTPTLAPGDRLVVARMGRARPGDLVALRDPGEPGRLLVKRVAAVLPTGVEVRGDNEAASRDSRTFGPVAPSCLIGRAVYRYYPPARVGFLGQSGSSSGTLESDGPAPERHRSATGTRADQ